MSPRRARIQKVVELRSENLEKSVSELTSQRAHQLEAEKAVEAQRQQVKPAPEQRQALGAGETSIDSWQMADDWLKTQGHLEQLAIRKVATAERAVEQARVQVLSARADLRAIEALVERIDKEENDKAERIERRFHDELAAARFAKASQKADR